MYKPFLALRPHKNRQGTGFGLQAAVCWILFQVVDISTMDLVESMIEEQYAAFTQDT